MKKRVFLSLLLCAALTAPVTVNISAEESPDIQLSEGINVDDNMTIMDEEGNVIASGDEVMDMVEAARPAPGNLTLSDENSYPYLGIGFNASANLQDAVKNNQVFVDVDGSFKSAYNEDGSIAPGLPLDYGYFHFTVIPESEQGKIPYTDSPDAITDYDAFAQWLYNDTAPLGRISIFHTEYLEGKDVAELTGMENNTKIADVEDYVFYLSTPAENKELSKETLELVEDLSAEFNALTETVTTALPRKLDERYAGFATREMPDVDSVGEFKTVDLDGNEVTNEIFKDADLTIVNVWATWCSPCVYELPHLGELAEEMKDSGVQFVGIVHDTVNPANMETDKDKMALASMILEATKVGYPVLVPNEELFGGLLSNIQAFPTTYFVDKNGNFVTEPMMGALDKDSWKQTIEEVLSAVKE